MADRLRWRLAPDTDKHTVEVARVFLDIPGGWDEGPHVFVLSPAREPPLMRLTIS